MPSQQPSCQSEVEDETPNNAPPITASARAMVLQVSSFVLLPLIAGFPMLCLTAILLGLGEAAISPCMMSFLVGKIRLSNRGLAIGVYGAGEDIGILTGPMIVGYLYQEHGADFSFYITAVLMLTNILISIPLLRKATE